MGRNTTGPPCSVAVAGSMTSSPGLCGWSRLQAGRGVDWFLWRLMRITSHDSINIRLRFKRDDARMDWDPNKKIMGIFIGLTSKGRCHGLVASPLNTPLSAVSVVELSEHFGTSTNVVTTTELSPPQRSLATTEPTPPSRCFAVFSLVFLDAVTWKLPLSSAASFDPPWMHGEIRRSVSVKATPPTLPRMSASPLGTG